MPTIEYADPAILAANAGLDLDTYALARMIASEEGDSNDSHQIAVGECARNHASRVGVSISTMLLRSTGKNYSEEANGRFSEQGKGKWASTSKAPTRTNVNNAIRVLSGTDVTGGGIDFFSPSGQIIGLVQGTSRIKISASKYIKRNAKDGLQWTGPIDGINAKKLMVFRRAYNADATDALSFLNLDTSDDSEDD